MTPSGGIMMLAETLVTPLTTGEGVFSEMLARALKRRGECSVIAACREASSVSDVADHVHRVDRLMLAPAVFTSVHRQGPSTILYVPEASITPAAFLRARVLASMTRRRVAVLGLQARDYPGMREWFVRSVAPTTLVPSEGLCESLSGLLGDRVAAIGFGVDASRFRPAANAERTAARRSLGLGKDEHVFLHVGHVRRSRNLAVLAELCGPRETVLVLGNTRSTDSAEAERLRSAGLRVDIADVCSVETYYHAADSYVFPVRSRTGCIDVPMSVMEALACGLPVVATSFGALPEVAKHAKSLVLTDDPREIPSLARRLVTGQRTATETFAARYSWDAVAERVCDVLDSAEQRAGGREDAVA